MSLTSFDSPSSSSLSRSSFDGSFDTPISQRSYDSNASYQESTPERSSSSPAASSSQQSSPGDAILTLLSLGGSTPSPKSPMKTPSPQSVAALEKRITGGGGDRNSGRFEFTSATKENERHTANLPPRESTYKRNLSAHKRAVSVPRVGSNTITPPHAVISLTHAKQTLQPLPPPHTHTTTPIHPKSPPRKIVPTHIDDDNGTVEKLPTQKQLSLELNVIPPFQHGPHSPNSGNTGVGAIDNSSHLHLIHPHTPPSTTIDAARDMTMVRSASAPSHPTSPLLVDSYSSTLLSKTTAQTAYIHQLLRARSAGTTPTRQSVGAARPVGSPTKSVASYHCSRVRVCIKPIDQIKIRATTLLDEARTNNKSIRTYQFP